MSQTKIVARYHNVDIIESCGYYYPVVNTNVECKTIKEVKHWIKNTWVFVDKGLDRLAISMEVDRVMLKGFFINQCRKIV